MPKILAAQIINNFFEVPQLDDEIIYRRARLLSFLINLHLLIAASVSILFSTVAFAGYVFPVIAFLSCIPALGIRLLIHRGRIRLATSLFFGLLVWLLPLAVLFGGSSAATVTVTEFQFITIVMAGLLLNEIEILTFVLLTLLINATLLYAESNSIYLVKVFIRSPFIIWITQIITYSAVATLVWMAGRLIKDSFKRANVERVERVETKQREQNYRVMLENVFLLGKTVTEVADFNTTLTRIWDGVRNGLDFDRVGIFIYNPGENIMQGSIGTDRDGNMAEEWDLKVSLDENSFFYNALSRPDGFSFTDTYDETYNVPPDNVMAGVKHNAAIACWSGDKPIAIIVVDQLLTKRPITEEQLEALRLFAGYAGLAIQNARLSEHEKYRRGMLEKVIQLGKTVTEAADFRTTLSRIWDCVRNGLDFDRVGIFIYNPSENIMQGSYGTDQDGKIAEEWDVRYSLDPGTLFYNALSRPDGYALTEDFDGDYSYLHLSIMAGVKHNVVVACWSGDKPIAILAVDQLFTNRPITKDQLEALRLFAGYAGLAIQNARLNAELEEQVYERGNFITELGTRNAELERFTYTVSHELKSPIVTITNFLELIDKSLSQKKYETAQKDFHRIQKATTKMHDTLSDLLKLSRTGNVINPYERFNVDELVQEALETTNGRIQMGHITIHVAPDLPSVYGDRLRILEVFENLIDNAAKYIGGQNSPSIEIGVRDQIEPVFYVKDNGMGIEPQYHTKIFDLFDKLDPTSDGTGVGLALIKRIIELHGGRIWVESEGTGKGSTFCFTIPQKTEIFNK